MPGRPPTQKKAESLLRVSDLMTRVNRGRVEKSEYVPERLERV